MKDKFVGYKCSICHRTYAPDEITYVCPHEGGNLDVLIDIDRLKGTLQPDDMIKDREPSLWRYLPLLPVFDAGGGMSPLHTAGWTPVYSPRELSEKIKVKALWVKDESRNPSASFKDRASAVVVSRAREIGAEVIVTASTGNAGAALAAMSAAIGQSAVIFAPRSAPPAKIAQLLVFGARVILVDGSYDDAFDLSIAASSEFGWYCRNTGYNPFTAEGKKTAAYEIWEWMWVNNPEILSKDQISIFIPVGDGNIISGIHKGFKDLTDLGWLARMPRLFGVQAEGSNAIANAFRRGSESIEPVTANTLADSISVDLPRDGIRAIRAVRDTGGSYILVSDDEILSAIASLGRDGIFAEPAGAAAMAGFLKSIRDGILSESDHVFVLNTGSGLKDIKATMQAVTGTLDHRADIGSIKRVIK
jgi:threonine synthase